MVDAEPEDGDADEHDQVDIIDVADMLQEATDDDQLFRLPPHQRCAAHTMNLVANDSENASANNRFNKVTRSAMGKCQALWNKQRRSSTSADIIRETCGRLFVVPCATRWNSLYYALQRVQDIMAKSADNLDGLMDKLGLPRFTQVEIAFIAEYVKVMKPVAQALNILQGQKNIYLGFVLPTVAQLQKVLDAQVHDLRICAPLVDALLLSLKRRFGPKFDDDQHILAAAVHPRFKLTWTDDEVVRTRAKRLLQDGISQIQLMEVEEAAGETQGDADVDDPDVDLFFPRPCSSTRESVEEVVDTHLHGRGSTLRDLHETVEKLFRKVNTTLPSSAAVERLFSHGAGIFKKNRYRLNDDTFEMQLMLKLNTT